MVEDQHGIPRGDALEARIRDWAAGRGESCSRYGSYNPPSPGEPRNQHHGQPGKKEARPDHRPPPNRVNDVTGPGNYPFELRPNPGQREAQDLQPESTLRWADMPALVKVLGRAAANLPA